MSAHGRSGDLRHEGGCCLTLGAATLGFGFKCCGADAHVCRVDTPVDVWFVTIKSK